MKYWLMKSEPGDFSVDDLASAQNQTDCWDGIRNYQVRNMMRDDMRRGDLAFLYHSNCPQPGIVGIMTVARESYPDHTAFDPNDKHFDPKSDRNNPRWFMIDVKLKRKLNRIIELCELRKHADKQLKGLALLNRGNRLSIVPVTDKQWRFILDLE